MFDRAFILPELGEDEQSAVRIKVGAQTAEQDSGFLCKGK